MKLIELDACFIGRYDPADGGSHYHLESIDGAQGVKFQCPWCANGKEIFKESGRRGVIGAHYVLLWFKNARGALPVPSMIDPGPGRWTFSGDSIETLTLSPSVELTSGCRWHGLVENGEVRDA